MGTDEGWVLDDHEWVHMDTYMSTLPEWYSWPFEVSPHAARRMPMRGFNETDLRGMLVTPLAIQSDTCPGRFIVHCRWFDRRWDVIVEPDAASRVVIVVTAYSPSQP